MCFSASASFGASVLLAGTGVVAVKKIESRQMLVFATIPIIFGLQQFFEGVLWLTIANPELVFWKNTSIYFYLLFAQVIWPIWLPCAIWMMEPDKGRKKIIGYFMFIGVVYSAYIFYSLFAYDVSAVIEARHIRYDLQYPNLGLRRSLNFLIPVVPIFLSSLKWMKLLGAMLTASLIFALIFFFQYVISVWCFFAAILSVMVVFIIVSNKELVKKSSLK